MRARRPDVQGVVGGRDGGIASAYDVFNQGGSPTVRSAAAALIAELL